MYTVVSPAPPAISNTLPLLLQEVASIVTVATDWVFLSISRATANVIHDSPLVVGVENVCNFYPHEEADQS